MRQARKMRLLKCDRATDTVTYDPPLMSER